MTIIIYDNPISYETFGQTFSLFVVYARLEHTNSLERASNCDELSILYAPLYLIANLVQFDEWLLLLRISQRWKLHLLYTSGQGS